jgi:hypothetical protein
MATTERRSISPSLAIASYRRYVDLGNSQVGLAKAPDTPPIATPIHYGSAEQTFGDAARAVKEIPQSGYLQVVALRSAFTSSINKTAARLRTEFASDIVEKALLHAADDLHRRVCHP